MIKSLNAKQTHSSRHVSHSTAQTTQKPFKYTTLCRVSNLMTCSERSRVHANLGQNITISLCRIGSVGSITKNRIINKNLGHNSYLSPIINLTGYDLCLFDETHS
jgi:hypothetical protein